jgi:hypothetical protein
METGLHRLHTLTGELQVRKLRVRIQHNTTCCSKHKVSESCTVSSVRELSALLRMHIVCDLVAGLAAPVAGRCRVIEHALTGRP